MASSRARQSLGSKYTDRPGRSGGTITPSPCSHRHSTSPTGQRPPDSPLPKRAALVRRLTRPDVDDIRSATGYLLLAGAEQGRSLPETRTAPAFPGLLWFGRAPARL